MARTDADNAYAGLDPVISDPQLLDRCGAALVAASGGTGPTLQAMIDIGRMGQRLIPDSMQLPPSPGYERGRAAIKQLARIMGENRTLFRTAMRLVETFAPKTLDLFLKQKSRAGELITFAHVRAIMRADTVSQRTELIHYYYRYSPSPAKLGAQASELLGPRRSESSRRKQFDAAVFRVIVAAQTMKAKLDGHTQAYLFGPLCAWADGQGTLDMHELYLAADAHKEMVALQTKINWVVAILGRVKQALDERPDTAADSGDVVGS